MTTFVSNLSAIALASCLIATSCSAFAATPATTAPPLDRIGGHRLPHGAQLVCAEHVTGSPGGKNHRRIEIEWSSYGATQDLDDVVRHYQQTFSRRPETGASQQSIWRLDGDLIYYVLPASDDLSWLRCAERISAFRSVIVVSHMQDGH